MDTITVKQAMMKTLIISTIIICVSGASAMAAPIGARAAFVEGSVTVLSTQDNQERDVEQGDSFVIGDRITTKSNSAVVIQFDNGSRTRLDDNTQMTIKDLSRADDGSSSSIFGLAFGRARSFVTKLTDTSKFEYHTKAAIAGVGGTELVVNSDESDNTQVYNLCDDDVLDSLFKNREEEGCVVYVIAQGVTVHLTPHFQTMVNLGEQPTEPARTPDERFEFLNEILAYKLLFGSFTMIEHLGDRVSVPLIPAGGVKTSNENLENQYQQGSGSEFTGVDPPADKISIATGTVTVTTSH